MDTIMKPARGGVFAPREYEAEELHELARVLPSRQHPRRPVDPWKTFHEHKPPVSQLELVKADNNSP